MPSKRIIELDGLRGMAALLVVISHFFGEVAHGSRLFTFGWLGVDVFFVLSGFLIGSIILEQHEKPRFLRIFYLKRAARIIPVYAVVCIFALIAAALTAGHVWSDHPYGAGVYSVFGANIAMSLFGGGGEWLRPTWTLDVEEQFYLIMPILICFTPRKLLPSLLIALWGSAVVTRFALHGTNPLATLSLLPCRMDLLLSGVMIALLNRKFDLSRYLMFLRVTPLIAMLVLLVLVAISPFTFFLLFSGSLASIGIACFLLAIIHNAPEAVRFRSPVLRYFGQISYALYLVHQPISGLLHGLLLNSVPDIATPAQIGVTLVSVVVSIGVAAASWKWLESPILAWAQNYRFAPAEISPPAEAVS